MKVRLFRIVMALLLFGFFMLFPFVSADPSYVPFLFIYLLAGGDVLLRAGKNIFKGYILDENFLMSIASIGAFLIGEHPEGVAVMLFYQIGELFQSYAVHRSKKNIAQLMDLRPDHANLKEGATIREVDPTVVRVGDFILVKPGERVPLDATVIEGFSALDMAALTGESAPKDVAPGDEIMSGCVNLSGVLVLRVDREYSQSTVSRILELVEYASNKKAKTERFITRFTRYYTPIVVVCAVLLAALPPLILSEPFSQWIYRALIFLVVSCPCALVISVPMSFFGGIGGASRKGILVKGASAIESLAKTQIVVFDKTGTLTKGVFKVTEIKGSGISDEKLLEIAAYAECLSDHPIAASLKDAYGKPLDQGRIAEVEEHAGKGVALRFDGRKTIVGNARWMRDNRIRIPERPTFDTTVYVAVEGQYAGHIVIGDEIKPDSSDAIKRLHDLGIDSVALLTGDEQEVANAIGSLLSVDRVFGNLLPDGKVAKLEELLKETSNGGKLAFVGDGINDAPVLARADIGIAMGALGSDAAIEAADVVLMTDEPGKVGEVIAISRKTLRIAKENIILALGVKAAVMILGAFGIASMWAAVFADVGVTFIAVLNALRALRQ